MLVNWICDTEGWAFDIASHNIASHMSHDSVVTYRTHDASADVLVFHNPDLYTATDIPSIIKISGFRCLDTLPNATYVATNDKLRHIAQAEYMVPNGLDLSVFRHTDKGADIGFIGNVSKNTGRNYKGYRHIELAATNLNMSLSTLSFNKNSCKPSKSYAAMPQYYESLFCVVLLSLAEGCSSTIMEALACGVPVITTKVGYHGAHLSNYNNVIFVERSTGAVECAVNQLLSNDALYSDLAVNGRRFAEKNHDIVNIANQWKGIIDACI